MGSPASTSNGPPPGSRKARPKHARCRVATSGLLTDTATAAQIATPVYFMTEDDIPRGVNQNNVLTGAPFDASYDVGWEEALDLIHGGLLLGLLLCHELSELGHLGSHIDIV
jgi:hypothetical protein